MADVNEAHFVLAFSQRFHDSIDTVPGQSKNLVDAPANQSINQYIFRALSTRAMGEIVSSDAY